MNKRLFNSSKRITQCLNTEAKVGWDKGGSRPSARGILIEVWESEDEADDIFLF